MEWLRFITPVAIASSAALMYRKYCSFKPELTIQISSTRIPRYFQLNPEHRVERDSPPAYYLIADLALHNICERSLSILNFDLKLPGYPLLTCVVNSPFPSNKLLLRQSTSGTEQEPLVLSLETQLRPVFDVPENSSCQGLILFTLSTAKVITTDLNGVMSVITTCRDFQVPITFQQASFTTDDVDH